ncbi:MAG: type II toxin-antitoxin system VapC family toxin [Candidatus Aenigmarchaeota archaeon]|nr:type II toxin-antitoxin system VapC family toxin [Candidatus Aenigmarchaeota archaeon]
MQNISSLYLVDASVFLEVELAQKRQTECKEFLQRLARGEASAIISDFAIDSIMIAMHRHKKSGSDIRKFLLSLLLYKGLSIYSASISDKIKAAEHVGKFKLDMEDSIVLQCALSNGINEIVSLDPHFDKIKGIKRLEPSMANSKIENPDE